MIAVYSESPDRIDTAEFRQVLCECRRFSIRNLWQQLIRRVGLSDQPDPGEQALIESINAALVAAGRQRYAEGFHDGAAYYAYSVWTPKMDPLASAAALEGIAAASRPRVAQMH